MKKKVWLITGASSGLGKSIAKKALDEGAKVIGTFRNAHQARDFELEYGENTKGLVLDLSDGKSIRAAVDEMILFSDTVDVLVNNAGYGLAGAVEETSLEEARSIFEANFFGSLILTQLILPMMRVQKKGHIVQISSHGGFKAFPGFGMYNASKFALEGLSEAMAQELAPLGIRVTIVEPGPFRTNFAASAFKEAEKKIQDYDATAGVFRERMKMVNGKQEGDPEKAAAAIYSITNLDQPPLRLPLGKIALISLETKIQSVREDIERFRSTAEGAVYG